MIFVVPCASAPKIRLRWEIDLSPGAIAVPDKADERLERAEGAFLGAFNDVDTGFT